MVANFKADNKIYITGADKSEALLIDKLVDLSKTTTKKVVLEKFYDIDDNIFGLTIEVVDAA